MDFQQQIILAVVQAVAPVFLLLVGGQFLLNRFEISKKRRSQEIELAAFIRERQYEALENLYVLFGQFMALYRRINSPSTDLSDKNTKAILFAAVVETEASIDAAILRIGSEFTHDNEQELEARLGSLRQSVQIWRESIHEESRLPFSHSEQEDYLRFKTSFAETTAYLSSKIYGSLSPEKVKMEQANRLLVGAFSNKHEWYGIRDQ